MFATGSLLLPQTFRCPISKAMNSELPDSGNLTPLQAAIAKIRGAGLRITQPRIALLTLLIESDSPVTIETIHRDLQKKHPFDIVTIYRCLAAFEELGLVRRLYSNSGTSLWQIISEATHPYLLLSKITADSEPLEPALSDEIRSAVKRVEEILTSRGYTDITHKVQFFAAKPGEISKA